MRLDDGGYVPFRPRPQATFGFTLLELMTVLALLGVVLAGGLKKTSRMRDRLAVASARESVVGVFHRARMEAVASGGARIRLSASSASVQLWSGGVRRSDLGVGDVFGVQMSLSGGRDEAEIRLDALGLGRVASQTIRMQRGMAEARLVVSSYGRLTRP